MHSSRALRRWDERSRIAVMRRALAVALDLRRERPAMASPLEWACEAPAASCHWDCRVAGMAASLAETPRGMVACRFARQPARMGTYLFPAAPRGAP